MQLYQISKYKTNPLEIVALVLKLCKICIQAEVLSPTCDTDRQLDWSLTWDKNNRTGCTVHCAVDYCRLIVDKVTSRSL